MTAKVHHPGLDALAAVVQQWFHSNLRGAGFDTRWNVSAATGPGPRLYLVSGYHAMDESGYVGWLFFRATVPAPGRTDFKLQFTDGTGPLARRGMHDEYIGTEIHETLGSLWDALRESSVEAWAELQQAGRIDPHAGVLLDLATEREYRLQPVATRDDAGAPLNVYVTVPARYAGVDDVTVRLVRPKRAELVALQALLDHDARKRRAWEERGGA